MAERLDKILSHNGFGSRKDIRKLLRSAQVLINGNRIYDPGFQLNVDKDLISIDGEEIDLHDHLYLMMNKIMHTVSTNKDGEHQTVFDLLDDDMRTPYLTDKLHLVGRLDMDTEGLLLFTTDGSLTHRLISPKTHISKTYFVILEHSESEEHKKKIEKTFLDGIRIPADDNEPETDCQPGATVTWPSPEEAKKYIHNSSIFINEKGQMLLGNKELEPNYALLTIYEGKYHQVKRMFQAVENKVVFLKRISIGTLKLDSDLLPGTYKQLEETDLDKLN